MDKKVLEVGMKVQKYNGVILTVRGISRGMVTFARGYRNRFVQQYEQAPLNHVLKCSLYTIIYEGGN